MSERDDLEALAILKQALLDRRADDPIFNWEPTPKQKPFIESVLYDRKSENYFIAGNRAGKSDAGAYIGACLARFGGDPKSSYTGAGVGASDRASTGLVSSLTFRMSQTVIEPKYFDNGLGAGDHKPFIPDREIAEWRVSDRILKLKNGSVIYFLSQDMGRSRYQGLSIDWVHMDEEHEENVVSEIRIRIGAGRKIKIFGTATILPPDGMSGGISWMFGKVIQPHLDGTLKNVGLFGASIYDNPYIDREVIAQLEAQYGETERRIRLGGEWLPGLAGARAYTAFDRRLHVKPQGAPFARRPLCWFIDINVQPSMSGVGQRDGNIFRVYRELVLDEGNILEMVQLFVDAFPQHYGEIWIYGDATGKKRNAQTGTSDYYMILNAMRSYGAPVRMKVPEANPIVPDRINAVNRALKDERGVTSVEIDPSCVELIADLEQVLRDGRGGLKKTFNRSDSYARRTHISDALGYWISREAPIRRIVDMQQYKTTVRTPGYGFTG